MEKSKHTPLEWSINVLHLMLQATTILVEDIDMQLHIKGERFQREKKMYIKNYARCIEQARSWMDKFGLDTSCWEAVGKDSKAYTNIIADANELLRVIFLYVDRAHSDTGYYEVMRSLRHLPENGLFPESYIARFNFKHEWIYGSGDRVRTANHGDGTLYAKVNGAWIVNLDDGNQIVLREEHFKLI